MPVCVVCGDPVYLHVDQQPFCTAHAYTMVQMIESTIDHLKRNQVNVLKTRFITVGEYHIFRKEHWFNGEK